LNRELIFLTKNSKYKNEFIKITNEFGKKSIKNKISLFSLIFKI